MMSEDKDKSRFLDFFRTLSVSDKSKKTDKDAIAHKRSPEPEPRRRRYDSDDDDGDHAAAAGSRKHRRRSPELRRGRHDGLASPARWPPQGVEELPLGKAMDLICRGVPIHKGHQRPVPRGPEDYYPLGTASSAVGTKGDPYKHADAKERPDSKSNGSGAGGDLKSGGGGGGGDVEAVLRSGNGADEPPLMEHYMLAAATTGGRPEDTDCANLRDIMARPMTMRRAHPDDHAENPWDTLEQPSYSFYFGKLPGTISLTQWVSTGSNLPPPAEPLPDNPTGVTLRDVELARVFERIRELEKGVDEDEVEDELYRALYRRFLRDPDRDRGPSPQRSLDRQIADLVVVLSRREWIDFANPKNQIVTRFIFDATELDPAAYLKFFQQLVLALELEMRVTMKQTPIRDRLIAQFPPTVQWSLALARRWKDNVRVEAYGSKPEQVKLKFRRKRKQVKMLEDFARIMKWPNLSETIKELRQKDGDNVLDSISSHALAFFSGLVLPGATWPFIIICTLIDVDPDSATDKLALLTHLQPHCGFQYRNTHTYWSTTCIVGKVLAPTARSIGGWVGPCRPTDHLGRSQIAKIRSYRPLQRMPVVDIASMTERSDPLGPPANVYPVHEYDLLLPELADSPEHIAISQLCFKAISATGEEPRWFEAAIRFDVDGLPVDLRLKYDVSFISAFPCCDGPHPLFFDYTRRIINVDDLMGIQNWGALHTDPASGKPPPEDVNDKDKVLAIEAYGNRDNEVFARAWCSHWGLSAVVADIRRTW